MPCGRRWVRATSAWSDPLQGGSMSHTHPMCRIIISALWEWPPGSVGTVACRATDQNKVIRLSLAEGWEPPEAAEGGGHVGGGPGGRTGWAGHTLRLCLSLTRGTRRLTQQPCLASKLMSVGAEGKPRRPCLPPVPGQSEAPAAVPPAPCPGPEPSVPLTRPHGRLGQTGGRGAGGGRVPQPSARPRGGRPLPGCGGPCTNLLSFRFQRKRTRWRQKEERGENPECLMRFVKSPPHNAAHRHRLLPPPTAHCRPSVGRPGQPRAAWAQAGLPVLGGRGLGPTEEELAEQTPAHPVFPGVTGTSCPVAALSRRELWLCPGGHCPLG